MNKGESILAKPSAAQLGFARHETFHIREGWLYKGLSALQEDGFALHQPDIHHRLGIGVNMLRSLMYWIQATGLVQTLKSTGAGRPKLVLTQLGQTIWERDPYFEDDRTLWLLHAELCSNKPSATMWYWLFNEYQSRDFTESGLVESARLYVQEQKAKGVADSSIAKDARCLIRTYCALSGEEAQKTSPYEATGCPLTSLGLVRRSPIAGHYSLQIGLHRNLPTSIFAYSLYKFRDSVARRTLTLSIEDIRRAPLSPGKLLCLDGRAVVDYLERLEASTSYARVIRTAELNMVSLNEGLAAADLLERCYADGD